MQLVFVNKTKTKILQLSDQANFVDKRHHKNIKSTKYLRGLFEKY